MKTRYLARLAAATLTAALAAVTTAGSVAGAVPPPVTTLTAGGYDAGLTPTTTPTMSALTGAISPDPTKRVLVFVTIGSGAEIQVTAPALSGGRVTWRVVTSVTRGNHLGRLEVLYSATGVQPGQLRFTFPSMKGWLAWSVVQAPGNIVQTGTAISENRSTGGRVASLTASLPSRPAGVVIAGFTSGQTGDMLAVSPAVTLVNGHSSYITSQSQFARSQSQSASWALLAHAMAIVAELR
jgi:hypothetical protein